MKRNTFPVFGIVLFFIALLFLSALALPARAQGPVENAQATIFAATVVVQQTRDARDAESAAQQATVTRLDVLAREQAATRAAIAANETSVARTVTAQANRMATEVAATSQANGTATAISNAQATATAQAARRASETAQAQASETMRAEQTADARASRTRAAAATATQVVALALQLDSQLERERWIATGLTWLVVIGGAALIVLAFRWSQPRAKTIVVEVAPMAERAADDLRQPVTRDVPPPAPVTIDTRLQTANELYQRMKSAVNPATALPPGN